MSNQNNMADVTHLAGEQGKAVSKLSKEWPYGSTVKLVFIYGSGAEGPTGWAKRDADGNLVSAYGLLPLDPTQWDVVEERKAPPSNYVRLSAYPHGWEVRVPSATQAKALLDNMGTTDTDVVLKKVYEAIISGATVEAIQALLDASPETQDTLSDGFQDQGLPERAVC